MGTLDPESCLWPTLDPTPTDPNFSCVPPKHHGSMENTWFSDKSSKAWMSLRRLNHLDLNRANVHKKLLLLTVANSHKNLREKKESPKSVYTIKKKQQPNSSDRLHFLCTTEIMLLENDTPLTSRQQLKARTYVQFAPK